MFRLRCWFDKKTGIVFNCFTKDQNWYSDVENINPLHVFWVQDFVYFIESLGEIIFHIFKLKK